MLGGITQNTQCIMAMHGASRMGRGVIEPPPTHTHTRNGKDKKAKPYASSGSNEFRTSTGFRDVMTTTASGKTCQIQSAENKGGSISALFNSNAGEPCSACGPCKAHWIGWDMAACRPGVPP